jgi:hypothetical protein
MKLNIATLAFCISTCLLAGVASAARVGNGFGINGQEEPTITQSGPNLRANAPTASLQERLTAEGLTQISNGLYAKHNESGENFVATNAAGRRALAAKVGTVRDTMAKRYAKTGASRRAQVLAKQSADIIADLTRPAAKSAQFDEQTGSCGYGSVVRAQAASSDGNTASAFGAVVFGFGPPVPTDNFAIANTNYVFDMSSAIGATPATASVVDYQSCDAQAFASVTCLDGYSGVSAYAYSVRPFTQYCEIVYPN